MDQNPSKRDFSDDENEDPEFKKPLSKKKDSQSKITKTSPAKFAEEKNEHMDQMSEEEGEEDISDEFLEEDVVMDRADLSSDEEGTAKSEMFQLMGNLTIPDEDEEEEKEKSKNFKIWRKGRDPLGPDEELEFDPVAYVMLHKMNVQWPCLSFDVLIDSQPFDRKRFPLSGCFVSGSQAEHFNQNRIYVLKISKLHRLPSSQSDESSDEEDEEDDEDNEIDHKQPELSYAMIAHPGTVNRIRSMGKPSLNSEYSQFVATWSEDAKVYIWNLQEQLKVVDKVIPEAVDPIPVVLGNHASEGFAMDWSGLKVGSLVTGDCQGKIFLTSPIESGWTQSNSPFSAHSDSVEDLQWSPVESSVFASCSVDHTIKIWDTRMSTPGCSFVAGDADINVIAWHKKTPHLLASGCDDGSFRAWDLRSLKKSRNACDCIGFHKWHQSSITSIEWDPNDESTLAVSSDDLVTIWDLSLEHEDNPQPHQDEEDDIPPQLLFEHMGQTEIKEIHWHPQLPSVLGSTSSDSFNLFKPNITEN